jgi:hypothetical protein
METLKMETSIKGNNGTAKGTFELQDWIQTGGISYYHFTPLMQLQNWILCSFSIGCFGYVCNWVMFFYLYLCY